MFNFSQFVLNVMFLPIKINIFHQEKNMFFFCALVEVYCVGVYVNIF